MRHSLCPARLRAVRQMSSGGDRGGGGTAELQRRIERAGDADAVRAALAEAIAGVDVAALAQRGEGGGAAVSGEWLAFVLDVVVPQWAACFTGAERERLVDAFFARAEAQEALAALHAHVARPGAHAEGLQPIAELLVRRVPELIRAAAASPSAALWPLTLTALLSLPERLANRGARLTPALHPTSAPRASSVAHALAHSACSAFADAVAAQAVALAAAPAPAPALVAALLAHIARLGHGGACGPPRPHLARRRRGGVPPAVARRAGGQRPVRAPPRELAAVRHRRHSTPRPVRRPPQRAPHCALSPLGARRAPAVP